MRSHGYILFLLALVEAEPLVVDPVAELEVPVLVPVLVVVADADVELPEVEPDVWEAEAEDAAPPLKVN
jgi:hypothetical protein